MEIDDIKKIVREYYAENDELIICTKRIEDRLAQTFFNLMGSGVIEKTKEAVIEKLGNEKTLDFLRERQPNVSMIDQDVIDDIRKYFTDNSISYIVPVYVSRASNHPEDSNLYFIIGYNTNDGTYACWSSWNETRGSLNYGHYSISSLSDAKDILQEQFNDITDEPDKYGMEQSMIEIADLNKLVEQNEETNEEQKIIAINRRGR